MSCSRSENKVQKPFSSLLCSVTIKYLSDDVIAEVLNAGNDLAVAAVRGQVTASARDAGRLRQRQQDRHDERTTHWTA